jgi:hypothetical protein
LDDDVTPFRIAQLRQPTWESAFDPGIPRHDEEADACGPSLPLRLDDNRRGEEAHAHGAEEPAAVHYEGLIIAAALLLCRRAMVIGSGARSLEHRTRRQGDRPNRARPLTFGARERSTVVVRYRLLRILLAVLAFSLTPQAHINPPDQTWLAGVYDGGDYDDLALMVLSDASAVDSFVLRAGDPLLVTVASAPLGKQRLRLPPRPSSSPPRAPPAS